MAETIISPGILTRENDISFVSPAPQAVGAAFIGPTVTGPIEQPTTVTSSYPENTQSSDSEITSMATPWSYNTNNMSLLYCPYQTSTFIVLINTRIF